MKLGEVAQIYIGILISREENKCGNTEYKLFTIKDYEENNQYQSFYTDKNFDEKLTQKSDLLFRLVYPNKIIYVDTPEENLLIPSQLCIIRTNKEKINPIFLKWYLESKLGKEQLMLEMKGSSIQKVSITSLKNIDIPEIEINKQRHIEDLINLWTEEEQTLEELIKSKSKLYNSIIEEIVMEGK